VDALADRIADEFNTLRGQITSFLAGKSDTGHTHAGTDIASGTIGIGRIPTGSTGTTVPFGNDSRFSDARTPTGHHSSHNTGGGDPIAPADIGAATSGHTHTPPTPYNFTYAATYAPNWANGEHHWCALTGNITIQEPTNVPSGKTLRLSLTASSAPRTVTIDSTIIRIAGLNSALVVDTGLLLILAIENNPAISDHLAMAKAGT
jgi:hypothetical protein